MSDVTTHHGLGLGSAVKSSKKALATSHRDVFGGKCSSAYSGEKSEGQSSCLPDDLVN